MNVLTLFSLTFLIWSCVQPFTDVVVINPAGDAASPGRRLVNSYERAVTLALAERLQADLATRYQSQVLLTRKAGSELAPFQAAALANRMNARAFISLHVYHHDRPKPALALFHLMYHPLIDRSPFMHNGLDLIPLHQAHYSSSYTSELLCTTTATILKEEPFAKQVTVQGIFGLPFAPLLGVSVPAFAIEIGLEHDEQWQQVVPLLVESFAFLKH